MITALHRYLSKRRYWLLIGIGVLTAATLALTLLPVDRMLPSGIWSYDKLGHLAIFGSWTFLVGYYRYLRKPDRLNLTAIFLGGLFFGIAIEILQYLMPLNRTADIADVLFDALGCLIGVSILFKISGRTIFGK